MTIDQDWVDALHRMADASAAVILPHFRAGIAVESKKAERFDPVTAADRAAEQSIREIIATEFPEHGIVGEEFGNVRPDAPLQWVIDPIDGTRAFIQGLPTWGTLIGLMKDGVPVAGLMNQPFTRERTWSDGSNSFFRGPDGETRRLATRQIEIAAAQMSTTDPGLFRDGPEKSAFAAVRGAVQQCRFGTDCYAYCLLAAGHVDVVMEAGLQIYDIVPLIPLIEHAGGKVTGWDGSPATNGGRILACGDHALHTQILAIIAQHLD